jgi:hypothetical protein
VLVQVGTGKELGGYFEGVDAIEGTGPDSTSSCLSTKCYWNLKNISCYASNTEWKNMYLIVSNSCSRPRG